MVVGKWFASSLSLLLTAEIKCASLRLSIHSVLNSGRCLPDPLPNKMQGDWAARAGAAAYGGAYRAYQPYYYAQGVANGAYPGGVAAGGVDQSTTTVGTEIKVRQRTSRLRAR